MYHMHAEIKSDSKQTCSQPEWKLSGFLETGQSQPLGIGSRFYILEHFEGTIIEVVSGDIKAQDALIPLISISASPLLANDSSLGPLEPGLDNAARAPKL
jgi:hypothetical protein